MYISSSRYEYIISEYNPVDMIKIYSIYLYIRIEIYRMKALLIDIPPLDQISSSGGEPVPELLGMEPLPVGVLSRTLAILFIVVLLLLLLLRLWLRWLEGMKMLPLEVGKGGERVVG